MKVLRGRSTALGVALLLALTTGCDGGGSGGEGHEHGEGHEEGDEHGEEHGHDEHAVAAIRWVSLAQPRDATLLELPAKIVASPESRAHIDTPLRGTVVSIVARVGDRVEAGDVLAELRIPVVLEAAAVLAGTRAQIGSHKARRERLEELQSAGLVGAGEVFDIDSGLGELSAQRRLALATLAAVGISSEQRGEVLSRGTVVFRAPIDGVVASLHVVPGEVVEPGEALAQILGVGPARIEVASSGALPVLSGESKAALSLEFHGLDGSQIALEAEPVATAVEPGLGRHLAWYATRDPELRLADGVRGRVEMHSDDPTVFELPRQALRLYEGRAWVGRESAGGAEAVEMIEVEVLRSAGSAALIRSEALALGDRVASDAATVLMLGREAGELGGGHHH